MSLKYGLNLGGRKAPPPPKKPIFGDDEDYEGDAPNARRGAHEEITSFGGGTSISQPGSLPSRTSKPPLGQSKPSLKKDHKNEDEDEIKPDASSAALAETRKKQAEELDPSIFDYDSFHDAKASVTEAKKVAAKQDAIERKPKYINNLMESAARRKQDQLVAREKFLQKEREAEGDEFADKEKFVTGAYKAQQEETRRLEAEEKKKAEQEEEQRRRQGGGMQGFYKNMMEVNERQHQEALEAAELVAKEGGPRLPSQVSKGKTDAQLAAELQAKGINVHTNEEGRITDKRQLLSAGLNITPSDRLGGPGQGGADHLKSSHQRAQQSAFPKKDYNSQQAQRERQSRMLEEQLAASQKRAREEEEEEKVRIERAAKSQKSEKDVSDAKARYLARKAAKEKGSG